MTTTAKKAPAAKKAAPAAKKTAAPAQPVPKTAQMPQGQIEFRGRTIRVRLAEPEQLIIWRRIWRKLETGNYRDWDGEQVMTALDQVREIIDSVLVDQKDVDWLDAEMLARRVTVQDAARGILVEAVQSFSNRATRRAATKGPARRKKAA